MRLSKSQYARHRKCSPSNVTKLLKAGTIAADANGLIDPAAADRAIAVARVRADSPLPRLDPKDANSARILAARARSEEAKAALLEMERMRTAGALLLAADVTQAWHCGLRMMRDQLLDIPARVATLVAAETDSHRVEMLLAAEVTRVLNDLADAPDGATPSS